MYHLAENQTMLGAVLEPALEELDELMPDGREFEWTLPDVLAVRLAAKKDAVDPDPEDEPADKPADEDDEDVDDEDADGDEDEDGREVDDDLIDLDDEWDEKDTDDDERHDNPHKFFE